MQEDEGHVSTDEQLIQNENALLHEQVTENWCVQENLFEDVHHLMILNNELETAVEALKGELWSLNGQLKAVRSYMREYFLEVYKPDPY